jgi:hypothetical protein
MDRMTQHQHQNQTKGVRTMKRVFVIVLAAFISVAFVTAGFAQAPAEKAPAAEKKAPAPEKKAEKKEKTMVFKGEVTAVDAAAKTITVKSAKGEETFDVSGVKNADKIKAGDKVTVKYMEKDGKKAAKSVQVASAKKAAKKEEKKEAAPAEPAKK